MSATQKYTRESNFLFKEVVAVMKPLLCSFTMKLLLIFLLSGTQSFAQPLTNEIHFINGSDNSIGGT